MATRIGIRELRDTLTATIRRVRQGETIEVTHDGRPVAVLSPYSEDRIERLLASGRATPPTRSIHPLPEPLAGTGSMTASEALEEDRSDR
jgi:prevent-host-death family protein